MRRLLRSMNYVSRRAQADRYADLYQQLGMAWEWLALQCRHWDGYRKIHGGRRACRICGHVRGTDETWLLLPRTGTKVVGRRATPSSKATFPRKRAASVVNDRILFHGAKLTVDVHNAYRSKLFRDKNVSIAADRTVRLEESEIECWIDTHLAVTRVARRKPGAPPPYGGFVWELPRKLLKRFPILLSYDRTGRLLEVTVFRSRDKRGRGAPRRKPRSGPGTSRLKD